MLRRAILFTGLLAVLFCAPGAWSAEPSLTPAEQELKTFLERYEAVVKPLLIKDGTAYWQACASGKAEDYAAYTRLETEYKQYHSNREAFALLKRLKESGQVREPLLARQLTIIYNNFARNQMKPEQIARIVALSTRIEKMFNTHRGTFQGRTVSDNQLKAVLSSEKDGKKRREAWEAQKSVAAQVAPLLVQLVKMRNEAARSMGYKNYYEMSLRFDEQDVDEVFRIFDDLAARTDEPFRAMKTDIDRQLSARWGIPADQMQPWHYQDFFFQERPDLGAVDLDAIFARHDARKLVAGFYASINLNAEAILARSDLYERTGKYQHAQCADLDREGDVRVMCNMRNNEQWTGTLMHELGHGVYSYYCDRTLPFFLRDSAHILTTEGIAQMFERLTNQPEWLIKVAGATPAEVEAVKDKLAYNLRMGQLVFCRWSQVMAHFERALYENPDQDLNNLWWTLVEKYQFVKRPQGRNHPDWASKIHFASSPAYYHNYLLGNLFAAQLLHRLATLPPQDGPAGAVSFVNRPDLGAYLTAHVFYPGARYPWNEMIRRATGEPLTARYYVEAFVQPAAR